ncbi:hypothetical protein INS49_012487 [Diaporthe citri]|uniref:uncharacterized protein n=1 Tax=Diaporthe citri TaxID=83186 RepID=UPI001C7FA30E|nr:uncharacterized protein INS49_012487 [Diaporthe citri]KAG6358967.1 hypothetical protein INS49_012487 [Diaporthe citri]
MPNDWCTPTQVPTTNKVFEEKAGNDPNAQFSIHYATSNHNGPTYPTRGELYQPPAGRGAAFPQIANVGGILVASYMSDVNGPNLNLEDGADFLVGTSTDDSFTWSDPTLIGSGTHRPGLLALDSTTFLALWTSDDLAGLLGIPLLEHTVQITNTKYGEIIELLFPLDSTSSR